MALDISSISSLISEFRALHSKDSVSPESLGYIMQRILDAVAEASDPENQNELAEIRALLDKLGKAGTVIKDLNVSPGVSDIQFSPVRVNLASGTTTYAVREVFIPHASQNTAGVMSAKDVTDLAALKAGLAELRTMVNDLAASGSVDISVYLNQWTSPVVAFDGFDNPEDDATFTESAQYATLQWLHIADFECSIVFSEQNTAFLRRLYDKEAKVTYWSYEWDAESDPDTGIAFPGSSIYTDWNSPGSLRLYFDRVDGGVYRYNDTWTMLEELVGRFELAAPAQNAAVQQDAEPENNENQ